MLTAEATIQSERPSRYILQLCRHAQQVQRLRNRGRALHDRGDAQPRPEVEHVEWSDARGRVSFGWGQCTMQATPTTLALRVEAIDAAKLQWIQDIVASNIERFGRCEHVKVNWQRRDASRRAHRRTVLLTSAGALGVVLAIVAHLGLGGALLATRWLDLTAVGLVAVPIVAVLAHAVVPMAVIAVRRRAARRGRASAAPDKTEPL